MPSPVGGKVGNLPQEQTSFVGRWGEVAEARRLLSASRLVTLTGVGGIGKTRLALRLATLARRTYGDEVWLVELGQLQDAALVAHTVATTLGLREQAGRPPMATLTEYLARRRVLLVLDTCEHLVDAVAMLAEALLRSCLQLRVLATSRESLGISGEVTLPVPSLSVPQRTLSPHELDRSEAVTLFADRAAAHGFTLTADNQLAVAEICRRLDGMPLAIELAAARLLTLSEQDILGRLSDRYRLLDTGPRSAPQRQQTLRSCIQWSYDLCAAPEQLLWTRLAVFVGDVVLDAAEDVCADDALAAENILDMVASLVDKSILIREDHDTVVRYRLLDTIRDYGQERLRESEEYAALRRRHRDWYEQLTQRAEADWISPRQGDWLARFDRELPNIRAALEFCLTESGEVDVALRMVTALHPFWMRGQLSEGRQWLERALALQTAPTTTGRPKALYYASVLAGFQGDVVAASALVEELRDLAEQLGDIKSRTLATQAAANVALFSGDLPGAVAGYPEVLDVYRAEGDLRQLLEALLGFAYVSGLLGDTERAAACHEEILAITEPCGEIWYRSYSLYFLGVAVWLRGDSRQAVGLVQQSLRLNRLTDEQLGTVWCLEALAWIAAQEHDPRRAATLLGAVESLSQATGTPTATFLDLLAYHDQYERQIRRELGEQAFQAAFGHGMGLSFEDAITYALGEKPSRRRHSLLNKAPRRP
jgi:predicted ATPase